MLSGIQLVAARPEHDDRASAAFERPLVRLGVAPARAAGNDADARFRRHAREPACAGKPVRCGLARPDNGKPVLQSARVAYDEQALWRVFHAHERIGVAFFAIFEHGALSRKLRSAIARKPLLPMGSARLFQRLA